MNKKHTGRDFDELGELFLESCGYKNHKEEEEVKDIEEESADEETYGDEEEVAGKKVVEEEGYEEEDEEGDLAEEGLFDGVKHTVGAAKDAFKGMKKEMGHSKNQRYIQGYMKQINKVLSDFATYKAKLDQDPDAAEKAASAISDQVASMLKSELSGGKKIDKGVGRNFTKQKGDAAAQYQQ